MADLPPNKYVSIIINQLIEGLTPAQILQKLLQDYMKTFSLVSVNILPFFSIKQPMNFIIAKKCMDLLSVSTTTDPIIDLKPCLTIETANQLAKDNLVLILAAFFSLFGKYSKLESSEFKTAYKIDDLYLPSIRKFPQQLIEKSAWGVLLSLPFIPEGVKFEGMKKLLKEQEITVVLHVLDKVGHLFSDLDKANLHTVFSKNCRDEKNNEAIVSIARQLNMSYYDYTLPMQSTSNNISTISALFLENGGGCINRMEWIGTRQQMSVQIKKLKPNLSDYGRCQLIQRIIEILKYNQPFFRHDYEAHPIIYCCFDILTEIGETISPNSVPETMQAQLISLLMFYVEIKDSQHHYVTKGALQSFVAVRCLISPNNSSLIFNMLDKHLSTYNDLILLICSNVKDDLTKEQLKTLLERWSSDSYYELIPTAKNALPFLNILPNRTKQSIANHLLDRLVSLGAWEIHEAPIYQLLFQYKSVISKKDWQKAMKQFKETALTGWRYPNIIVRVHQFKDFLPQEEIWQDLLNGLLKEQARVIHNTDQMKLLREIDPSMMPIYLNTLFNSEKFSEETLKALWFWKDDFNQKHTDSFWELVLPDSSNTITYSLSFLLDMMDYLNSNSKNEPLLFKKIVLRFNESLQAITYRFSNTVGERVLSYKDYLSETTKKRIAKNLVTAFAQTEDWDFKYLHSEFSLNYLSKFFAYLQPNDQDFLLQMLISWLTIVQEEDESYIISFLISSKKYFSSERLLETGKLCLILLEQPKARHNGLHYLLNLKELIPQEFYSEIIKKLWNSVLIGEESDDTAYHVFKLYSQYMSIEQKDIAIAILWHASLISTSSYQSIMKMKLCCDLYMQHKDDSNPLEIQINKDAINKNEIWMSNLSYN